MVVALGELLGGVGDPGRAGGGGHAGDARQVAALSREEAGVVRAAERPAQARDVRSDVTAGSLSEHHGLGAVLLLHVHELLGDEVVGLVPRDALPLVEPTVLRVALHGELQAFLVMRHLGHVQAAHAQPAVRPRVFRVAFALDQLAVGVGVHDHAAAQVTPRSRPSAATRDVEIAFLVLERLFVVDDPVLLTHTCASSSCRCPIFSDALHLAPTIKNRYDQRHQPLP